MKLILTLWGYQAIKTEKLTPEAAAIRKADWLRIYGTDAKVIETI